MHCGRMCQSKGDYIRAILAVRDRRRAHPKRSRVVRSVHVPTMIQVANGTARHRFHRTSGGRRRPLQRLVRTTFGCRIHSTSFYRQAATCRQSRNKVCGRFDRDPPSSAGDEGGGPSRSIPSEKRLAECRIRFGWAIYPTPGYELAAIVMANRRRSNSSEAIALCEKS